MCIQEPDIELWLTGGGNAEKYIQECAKSINSGKSVTIR